MLTHYIALLVLSVCVGPLAAQQPRPSTQGLWQEHMALGEHLERQGSYMEAKEEFRLGLAAIGADQAEAQQFVTDIHLAAVSAQLGQYTEAEQWGNRAMLSGISLYGADGVELAVPLLNLAIVYRDQNQNAKAEQAGRRVLELLAKRDSHHSVALAATMGTLGTVLYRRGELRESEQLLRQGIEEAEKLGASNLNVLAENLSSLAVLCRHTGRQSEAASLFQRAYLLYEQAYGVEHPELVPILTALATLKADSGEYPEAIQENEHAVRLAERAWGPNHPLIRYALLDEASWLRKLHRKDEAKRLESRARAIEKATAQNSLARYTVDARDVAALPPSRPHR